MTIRVVELRTAEQVVDVSLLARIHHEECAPHLPFDDEAIFSTAAPMLKDDERKNFNCWVAYKDDEPIGYAVAYNSNFFFNFENISKLEIWYVIPACRGTWAAIKLIKKYEEWSRLNAALQMYVGVARLDKDEAKHIRKLFPKLGYDWCGSYYVKETI